MLKVSKMGNCVEIAAILMLMKRVVMHSQTKIHLFSLWGCARAGSSSNCLPMPYAVQTWSTVLAWSEFHCNEGVTNID